MGSRLLHRSVIYPTVIWAIGEGRLFARLEELRALERVTPEALGVYGAERLASLLSYTRERCPFYRARWPSGLAVTPDAARETLAGLPFVTKRDVQDDDQQMMSEPTPKRITRKITGGSTGQAVSVAKDRAATAYERAAMWLGYGWRGVRIGDRCARFWGTPFATRRRLATGLSDFAMNRTRFSAFAFTERDLARYWRRCLAFRPDYLHGYVSMLEAFARFLADHGYDGRRLGLKSIVATSEVLTGPQRSLLEGTFGAPVQIEYGCGELGPIAYECEQGALHLMAADVVVELLDQAGHAVEPGTTGEIVVTDLNNRAMPLVRYRLGDFGVFGKPCACGRSFPVLEKVWGRAYDFVASPSGRRYHGEFFMYLFEDLRRDGAGVQAFQVTQDSPTSIDVAIVTPPGAGAPDDSVQRTLQERLPGMHVKVRRVSRIERMPSGKMQLIRNDSGVHHKTPDGRTP